MGQAKSTEVFARVVSFAGRCTLSGKVKNSEFWHILLDGREIPGDYPVSITAATNWDAQQFADPNVDTLAEGNRFHAYGKTDIDHTAMDQVQAWWTPIRGRFLAPISPTYVVHPNTLVTGKNDFLFVFKPLLPDSSLDVEIFYHETTGETVIARQTLNDDTLNWAISLDFA